MSDFTTAMRQVEHLKAELGHAYTRIDLLQSDILDLQEKVRRLTIYVDQQTS